MEKTGLKPRLRDKIYNQFLNDHAKKIIFLSSITAYLNNVHTPEKALAQRLNSLMHVGERSNSMVWPIVFNKRIWKDLDLRTKLSNKGLPQLNNLAVDSSNLSPKLIRIIANIIIDNTPAYLVYGSKKNMRDDLFFLFKNYDKVSAS